MSHNWSHNVQGGFAIVSAIFILVILAALGAYVATVSTTQQIGSALDVQGARAYQAARSGTEWGLHRAIRSPSGACDTGSGIKTNLDAIGNMTVSVTCITVTPDSSIESGMGVLYKITANACNTPNAGSCPGADASVFNYVERQLSVVADTTPP